jgi:tRNA pseudouridine55 synthase
MMGTDGLLIIDKPQGMTSAGVVRIVKRRLQCKTGHLGTLDPFATGVLPVCVGEGTKIAQFLSVATKTYTGTIRLGRQTDTGDLTGTVINTAPVPPIAHEQLAGLEQQLRGDVAQIPPMYSAIKHHGTPLYKLARRGIEVERQPRQIHIDTLNLTAQGESAVAFSLSCSKGTYVRALAEQIGVSLGTVAHLEALRRTRFGAFSIEQALTLDAIEQTGVPVIGLREALSHLREIRVDEAAERRARQGYKPVLATITGGEQDEAAKLVGPTGELAAVIVSDRYCRWRFARVFT